MISKHGVRSGRPGPGQGKSWLDDKNDISEKEMSLILKYSQKNLIDKDRL